MHDATFQGTQCKLPWALGKLTRRYAELPARRLRRDPVQSREFSMQAMSFSKPNTVLRLVGGSAPRVRVLGAGQIESRPHSVDKPRSHSSHATGSHARNIDTPQAREKRDLTTDS